MLQVKAKTWREGLAVVLMAAVVGTGCSGADEARCQQLRSEFRRYRVAFEQGSLQAIVEMQDVRREAKALGCDWVGEVR